jgi:hypothetical protein
MAPACSPQPVHDFHLVLVPFMEARSNHEPSYIRDNAKFLCDAAKPVPKSKACCNSFDKKAFRLAANDLTTDCQRLQQMSQDKAIKDDAVLAEMKIVEDDFVKVANSCQ